MANERSITLLKLPENLQEQSRGITGTVPGPRPTLEQSDWLILFISPLNFILGETLLRHISKIPIFSTHPDKNAYCRKLKGEFVPFRH